MGELNVDKYNKEFTGVWVPRSIWENKELGWTEKMLLVEIKSLDNANGCYALNDHFSKFFGLSKDRISKMVTELRRLDYIDVELKYKEGTKQVIGRVIRVNINKYEGMGDNTDRYGRKILEPIGENADTPIGENAEDNNTISFNNTINNTSNINTMSTAKADNVSEVIELVKNLKNLPSAKKYTEKRKSSIKARVEEYGIDTVMENLKKMDSLPFFIENKKNKAGWYDMDWVFNPNNFIKVIEGKYDNIGIYNKQYSFNKDHQPYVSPSHQVTQQKELIQILEEELPF